ncbi:LysM peptidoglycan-binding domain-containing protein [Nocardioides sp. SYSU D00065]|uniref:LysM peptidoglycan-binding domain-containing protein n=1 Tax=Nocardioides sp. SYSU D00065 TaxID=2817378 RepID=UPI001B333006|nr:LysM peptidoglycan-binding domain-containing protein [Nocardioides sp. SYSU D00065]
MSAAALAAVASAPEAWRVVDAGAGDVAVLLPRLLVAACSTALAAALAWLWVVTTTTVVGLVAGRPRTGGATRRLVLVACGAVVVTAAGGPALADPGRDGREALVGLSLPDRPAAPVQASETPEPAHDRRSTPPAAPPEASTYVIRPGDSLWSIARAHPGVAGSVDERWRAIWRANRDVVGDDPDLILPGQALRLPGPDRHRIDHPSQDGDRP